MFALVRVVVQRVAVHQEVHGVLEQLERSRRHEKQRHQREDAERVTEGGTGASQANTSVANGALTCKSVGRYGRESSTSFSTVFQLRAVAVTPSTRSSQSALTLLLPAPLLRWR